MTSSRYGIPVCPLLPAGGRGVEFALCWVVSRGWHLEFVLCWLVGSGRYLVDGSDLMAGRLA